MGFWSAVGEGQANYVEQQLGRKGVHGRVCVGSEAPGSFKQGSHLILAADILVSRRLWVNEPDVPCREILRVSSLSKRVDMPVASDLRQGPVDFSRSDVHVLVH